MNNKRLFLTYPQCPATRETLKLKLEERLGKFGIEKLAIGQERHQDGNLHLHALIILKRRCNISDLASLDIEFEGKKYHGKYEPMKFYWIDGIAFEIGRP